MTTMPNPVRLVLADDTELVLRAVRHTVTDCCPGVEVIGEAKDYDELFRVVRDAKPHVVLMDMNMPSQIDLSPDQIRLELGSCCLLVMSAWFDEPTKIKARACGAVELLEKMKLSETLRPAIERCLNQSKAAGQ
jgi:DNA-binding NarL/FixJ family response regulator